MTDAEQSLAGYRLVRRIGGGRRAQVYLCAGSGAVEVAVKVFPAEAAADADLSVLAECSATALPQLRDVASLPGGGIAVVLERLDGPTLPQLLKPGRILDDGEFITIVAPLLSLLSHLHAKGWMLGTLPVSSIRFSGDGRAVVTSLHQARRIGVAGSLERTSGIRADYAALAQTIDDLRALGGRAPWDGAALLRESAAAKPLVDPLPEVEAALFGNTAAAPVRLHDETDAGSSTVPERLVLLPEPGAAAAAEGSSGRLRALLDRWGTAADSLSWRAGVARLRRLLPGRRGPLVAAGVVAVIAVVAVVLLPPSGRAGAEAEAPDHRSTPSAGEAPKRSAPPEPSGGPDAGAAEDPAEAALGLLAARDACLQSRSLDCLAEVDQPGSPLLEADRRGVEAALPPHPLPHSTARLASLTGDAAVVELTSDGTAPVALLLMRGKTGWRLRDVFLSE